MFFNWLYKWAQKSLKGVVFELSATVHSSKKGGSLFLSRFILQWTIYFKDDGNSPRAKTSCIMQTCSHPIIQCKSRLHDDIIIIIIIIITVLQAQRAFAPKKITIA